MDYRCPVCRRIWAGEDWASRHCANGSRVFPHCRSKIHLNVHRAEEIAVLLGFGTVVALAACALLLESRALMLAAFGAAMAGALAFPCSSRPICAPGRAMHRALAP